MHELDIVQGNFSRAVLLAGEVIGDGLPKHVIPSLYVTPIDAEISA
jgi:hypothetical protein